MTSVNAPSGFPAGWYPDPWSRAPLRYYDGYRWTSALAPLPTGGPDPTSATDRMLLPVGRTPLAIVTGYVALFSVLLAPAPISLTLGIWALVQLRARPDAYGRGRAIFAIVMGAIFTPLLIALVIARNVS